MMFKMLLTGSACICGISWFVMHNIWICIMPADEICHRLW